MNPIINIGTQAVREAAKVFIRSMEHLEAVDIKTEDRRLFTAELKRLAAEEITAVIQKAHPAHKITSEDATHLGTSGEACWLVDALDGEINFAHGLPHCAISLALKLQNKITTALVYDFLRDELFIASQGQGARLNDRRLRVSQTKKLNESLLGLTEVNSELAQKCQGLRQSGSVALDLAYVAAARLDGFYQSHPNSLITAAGILLVTEAGGMINTDKNRLLLSNPKIHQEFLGLAV